MKSVTFQGNFAFSLYWQMCAYLKSRCPFVKKELEFNLKMEIVNILKHQQIFFTYNTFDGKMDQCLRFFLFFFQSELKTFLKAQAQSN